MKSNIQYRGHCQMCGRIHAIGNGTLVNHGYTVEQGWFQGVCHGAGYSPIEVDRKVTDQMVITIRADVVALEKLAKKLKAGKVFPKTAPTGWKKPDVPFEEATPAQQKDAINRAIYDAESRAKQGTFFASAMIEIADTFHGKEVLEVEKKIAAPRIMSGEKKMSEGTNKRVLTCSYQDGARVYYTVESVGLDGKVKKFKGWIGTRAWRSLVDAS
jgi:hypothetical protein